MSMPTPRLASTRTHRDRPRIRLPLAFACVLAAASTALLIAARATPGSNPPKATAFEPVLRWPASSTPPSWATRVAENAARAADMPNLRQAGLSTLWLGLLDRKAPWFPYLERPFDPALMRSLNFGASGLLLAKVDPGLASGSAQAEGYEWAALFAPREPAPLAETAAFAEGRDPAERSGFPFFADSVAERHPEWLAGTPAHVDTALSTVWSGGLGCYAAARGLGQVPLGFACDSAGARERAHGPACLPVASRRAGTLELVRPSPTANSACLFSRGPLDDRLNFADAEARMVCMTGAGGVAFPSLDTTLALFPTSSPGVFLAYEPLYSPPKVSVLELGTGTVRPAASATLSPFAAARGASTVVAQGFEGLYACEQHGMRSWYFVESDLFEGRRAPTPTDDRAFRVTVVERGDPFQSTLTVESIDWAEIARQVPSLDVLPRAGCFLAPAIDLKCALAVVRTAGQIALEVHAGAWDEALAPQVLWGAFGTMLGALGDVAERAPHFALSSEIARLEGYFRRELEALAAAHPEVTGAAWWKASDAERHGRHSPAAKPDDGERTKLLSLLGLPPALWTALGTPTGRTNAPSEGKTKRHGDATGETRREGPHDHDAPSPSENGDTR